jgi:mannitol/fructose-specific phosphotransferase system IIA component (Ntr-type)
MDYSEKELQEAATMLGFLAAEIPCGCAETRESALRFLLAHLVANNILNAASVDRTLQGILRREQLGSAGVGRGVAIPHITVDELQRIRGVLAVSRLGVSWDSVDGEPVHVICLCLSPVTRPGDYLRSMEGAAKLLRVSIHRPLIPDPVWFTATVCDLVKAIHAGRAFDQLPVLGDALEDAGCTNAAILRHCRERAEHLRRCWVVELLTSGR